MKTLKIFSALTLTIPLFACESWGPAFQPGSWDRAAQNLSSGAFPYQALPLVFPSHPIGQYNTYNPALYMPQYNPQPSEVTITNRCLGITPCP